MSVAQVQEVLRSALSTCRQNAQPQGRALYFTYGAHLNFAEFKEEYPGARSLGMGFLDNWTWHINSLGEANIRPCLIRTKAITVQSPTISPMLGAGAFGWTNSGTFGTIFVIPSDVEDRLDKKYCGSRVKICVEVKIVISHPGVAPVIRRLDCIMHYDPRNTVDGSKNIWTCNGYEKNKWLCELTSLRKAGVPHEYISEMSGRLEGHGYTTEPINLENVKMKLIKTEVHLPKYFLCFGSTENKIHRVHKHTALPIKQQILRNSFDRISSPENGLLAHRERQYSRRLQANCTFYSQGEDSMLPSRPLRRQEAIVAQPCRYTSYTQARSAAHLGRFRVSPSSASSDSPRGQHGEVCSTATRRQNPQLPGETPSWAAHAQPAKDPVVKIESQDEE